MKGLDPIPEEQWHKSMRGFFAGALYNEMLKNKNIIVLTGDLGFAMFDRIREDFPERFINCGAAEQSMMGIAVGLALEGKIPVVYSITPFLLFRAAETIRNYIYRENIPVKLIGSGRGDDYAKHDGFSHYAGDDGDLLKLWPNIYAQWPVEKESIPDVVEDIILRDGPTYTNLTR